MQYAQLSTAKNIIGMTRLDMLYSSNDAEVFALSVLSQLDTLFVDSRDEQYGDVSWVAVTMDHLIVNVEGISELTHSLPSEDHIRKLLRFMLAHEAEHIVRADAKRAADSNMTDPQVANVAADLLINESLRHTCDSDTWSWVATNACTIDYYRSRGWLTPSTTADNSTTEHLYGQLLKAKESDKQAAQRIEQDAGDDLTGTDSSGQDTTPGEQAAKRAVILSNASKMAEQLKPGSTPGNIKRELQQLADPTVDWRDILTATVAKNIAGVGDDETWDELDGDELVNHIVAPETTEPAIDHIIVALDTSGSVSMCRRMEHLLGELSGMLQDVECSRITLLEVDTVVHKVTEVHDPSSIADLQLTHVNGGGGTSFNPAFDWAWNELQDGDRSMMVYLTDGEGEVSPEHAITCDSVIWLQCGDKPQPVPFGDAIFIPQPTQDQ